MSQGPLAGVKVVELAGIGPANRWTPPWGPPPGIRGPACEDSGGTLGTIYVYIRTVPSGT